MYCGSSGAHMYGGATLAPAAGVGTVGSGSDDKVGMVINCDSSSYWMMLGWRVGVMNGPSYKRLDGLDRDIFR